MEKARRRTTASSLCAICNQNKAALKRPKTAQQVWSLCKLKDSIVFTSLLVSLKKSIFIYFTRVFR